MLQSDVRESEETVRRREVIFEFHQVGNAVKVTAFDPASLVEVSIVGPPSAGEAQLRATALRKLEYVLKRRAEGRG